jgi:S1-C subfamily serine protease
MRPMAQLQLEFNRTMAAINDLYDYITDVLGHEIDSQLRQEMNAELKNLDKVAKNLTETGEIAKARTGYNNIFRAVQTDVANYNNRLALQIERRAKEEAEQRERAAREAAEPQQWSGTGFALKDAYVVTNYHVVEGAGQITVRGINGNFSTSYSATVAAYDYSNDIAILRVNDSRFSGFGSIPYAIKTTASDVGENIFVMGYPLTATMGSEIKYTTGVISSHSGYQGDISLYQISAPIQPGNSGAPLFDSKGDIIGIVNSKHTGAENVGYAIKSAYLNNLMQGRIPGSVLPSSNSVSSLSRTEQIKVLQKYVYIIECRRSSGSFPSSYSISTNSVNNSSSTDNRTSITSLNRSEIALSVGDSFQLQAYPSDAAVMKWGTDNPKVATISTNGKIEATGEGETHVWAYSNGVFQKCRVIVKRPTYTSSTSSTQSSSTSRTQPSSPKRQADSEGIIITNLENAQSDSIKLSITRIIIHDSQTIIEFYCNNAKPNGGYLEYIQVDQDASIVVDGQTYKLIDSEGIKISPEKTYFSRPFQDKRFKLIFPPISKNSKSLDFIGSSSTQLQIHNVKLQ